MFIEIKLSWKITFIKTFSSFKSEFSWCIPTKNPETSKKNSISHPRLVLWTDMNSFVLHKRIFPEVIKMRLIYVSIKIMFSMMRRFGSLPRMRFTRRLIIHLFFFVLCSQKIGVNLLLMESSGIVKARSPN